MFIAWLLTHRFVLLLVLNSCIFVTIPSILDFNKKPTIFLLAVSLSENGVRKTVTMDDSDEEFKRRVQQNLLGDEYKSSVSAHNYLQGKAQFQGEYRDDQIFNDLVVDIGPNAWASMPNCKFYMQHKGVCDPFSAYSACRFCKEKVLKAVGLPKCPGDDSLVPSLQGKFHWALKPYRFKKKFFTYYLCVIESGPSVTQLNDTSTPFINPYHISHASSTLVSFSLIFISLLIFIVV